MEYKETPISLNETIEAFECCTSYPIDCNNCPLHEDYKVCDKHLLISWECRTKIANAILYWLKQVKLN